MMALGNIVYSAQNAVFAARDARAELGRAICDLVDHYNLRKAESPWTDLAGDWLTDSANKAKYAEGAAIQAADAIKFALDECARVQEAEEAARTILPIDGKEVYWRETAKKASRAKEVIELEANYLPHGWTENAEIVRLLGISKESARKRGLLDSLFVMAGQSEEIDIAAVAKRRKEAQDWLVKAANGYAVEAEGNMYP
jgi:hypothetical protein